MEYVRIIGSGANAVVYEARHQRTGVSYACKVFNRTDISDPAAIYCLEQEIRAGERIHNPHIVEVKETLYDHNAIVLVMELCKKSLLSNLSYGYPLSIERARVLFCQMLHQRFIPDGQYTVLDTHTTHLIHRIPYILDSHIAGMGIFSGMGA